MQTAKTVPCRLSSVEELFTMLKITPEELYQAIGIGYITFSKIKNGKKRYIQKPNDKLKPKQKTLKDFIQNSLPCPPYCTAGFKGQSNIKNAEKSRQKREVVTLDISHYFPNTQEKYIRKFFAETFGAKDEALDLLVKLTTYNGYLPTGAPTSTILVNFAHKDIFDSIYKKMQEYDIDMTVYVDDITLSSHKHIGNWVIKYINNALKTHGIYLKKSKTKRYSFRHAVVTGVHMNQSGKMSAPFKIGHSVIKALKEKDLSEMSITELQSIIAKIAYIQQFEPNKMAVTKTKAIKQLKKLQKRHGSTKTA